ncbi:MAG: SLBB domain-containing protein [Bacteroidales bacterium]|nr:SLBB domain-containing protein [Bacteroidales bacterium]
MTKKLLIIITMAFAFALAAVPAKAQMSDDAVIAYVKDGMATGKSQNDMIKELAAAGVTKEQAERIKQSMEKDQTGQTDAVKVAGAQERQRRVNQGVLETEAGSMDVIAADIAEQNGEEEESAKDIFGQTIFTNRNLTFAPSANLPTPINYRLGPGDEVIIDIWGTNQATIRQTISPEGYINIPDIGLVNLNGMTVKEADAYMRRKLSQIYSVDGADASSDIKLTLGNIRTIQVNLMGELEVPGTYSLSSFSNLLHAVYRAGGVSPIGSLRDIQLIRNGKKYATVDLYELILKGQAPDNLILEEGDIVIVPPYKQLVDIDGSVKRPMYYEMKDGETVQDIINYAGGFSGDAYKENVRIVRQNGREYQVFTVEAPQYDEFILKDGDAITVGTMIDRYENRLEIKGAVYRPGIYQLGDDINTVSQLIRKADGLKGDAFTNRGLLHREREDLTLEVIPLDIKAILDGTAEDIALKRNDIVYIASVHELKDIGTITIEGEVARPGTFIFEDNTSLEDIIMQAGGLLESASTVKIDVSRRIKDPAAMVQPESIADVFSFSFKDGYIIDGDPGFILQPYDYVYVRKSPGYQAQGRVTVSGEVMFPGEYVLTSKAERLSDLVARAGGLNQWAYVRGARLIRHTLAEERNRTRAGMVVITSGRDSVNVENLDLDDQYSVGIDLEAALANPGSEADLVLRRDDILLIPEYINTVKISGNVMYPNVVGYNSNMTVRDYVEQAGGYGYRPKRSKAYVIYMNGTIARARSHSRGVVEPGCEIVIPQKRDKESKLSEIMSVATTSSSIATMLATIYNIIK